MKKNIDPAVGSGAFLVGIMSEIVRVRNILSNYIDDSNRTVYNFKRDCIENSLYGVDIDPGAVEIAKLRLWLSLVVDEEDIKKIKPLPNLDYKIMQGNSLIEMLSYEFLSVSADDKRTKLVDRLKKAKDELFNITSPSQKEQKRHEINELITEIFEYDRNSMIDNLRTKINNIQNQGRLFRDIKSENEDKKRIRELENKIEEVREIKIPEPSEHFEWHINFSEVFQEKDGFDIVIANPPYGVKLNNSDKNLLDTKFNRWRTPVKNSAIYFIYSADSICQKKGINSFIVPKSLCYSLGWNNCAHFLVTNLEKLVDSGKAFEHVKLEQVIFIKHKMVEQGFYITGLYDIDKIFEFGKINKDIFNNYKVLLAGQRPNEIKLINKIITSFDRKWGDYVFIERGLNWQSKVEKFPGNVPIYRGSQLKPYFINKATDFVDISKFNEKEYKYLYKPKILNQLAIAHVKNPYPHFYLQAALDNSARLVFETISCTFVKNHKIDIKFLLAVNNSKLFAWLLYKFIYSNAIRSARYDEYYVSRIPVPDFENVNQHEYVELVNEILSLTEDDVYSKNKILIQTKIKEHLKQIDLLVYKIYGLAKEEIKIVEGF
jgi:hypothetical protein